MAVISNKQEALSRLILKALGVDTYFDVIAGGDTYREMKPSPLPLLKVIDEFSCSPAAAVMVGDSINDIQAGVRAGITTIGCSWGYGNGDELSEASILADSCSDIITIIRRLPS
jgi:phosphoglycolate phosphatase